MAYDVNFSVPSRPLGKTDLSFVVRMGDSPLGILKISKGALVWVPTGKKTGHKVRWKKFAEIAKDFPLKEAQ
jgi:hypothetical protein